MSCECITKNQEGLKEHLSKKGIDVVNLRIRTIIPTKNFTMLPARTTTEVNYIERKVSKSGNVREIKRKVEINNNFCPFCGTKYDEV
ncbi:hypothetical protein ACWA5Z_06485 [Testudinibacter sp. P80/BLE/0925]